MWNSLLSGKDKHTINVINDLITRNFDKTQLYYTVFN